MKLEKMFEKKLEEVEKLKEGEKKNASQERQANITSLKEKASELRELLVAWQGQFEVAGERIKEFKEASKVVTDLFEEDKQAEHHIIKEEHNTRDKFIRASRGGEYNEYKSGEDDEVGLRDKKREEVQRAVLTVVELKKAIKEALPEEVAKSINFSLKAVNKENVGFAIERAVLGIEEKIKGVVKEGVVERHKNGSVVISPEDERDMETLGKEAMENIILEQANKPIEEKRAKDFSEVESLEKDTQQMLFLEQRFPSFQGDITRMTKQLSYSSFINDLARRLAIKEQRDQVGNNLREIAEEFSGALSYNAIMKIFGDGKPERATEETKNEIYRTIITFDNEFSRAINNKGGQMKEIMGQRGGAEKRVVLVDDLKNELATIKNNAILKLQELQKMPDKEKYIDNPQAEELLVKKEKWEKSQASSRKNIWEYLNEKKANVNIIANKEKALAEASLNENFLALENRVAEAENSEVYNKVSEYYKKVKKLGEVVKQLEKAMAWYGSDFTIQRQEPFLVMTTLDQEIKKWQASKQEDNEEISKQEKFIKEHQGMKGWGHKKEIEDANKIIGEKKKRIAAILDPEIAKFKIIKESAQAELAKFFTAMSAMSTEWLDNEKLSQGIFKKHESGSALGNIVLDLEHRPNDFGIISDKDVEIYKKLGWQRETLKKAVEDKKQAEEFLSKAQTQATKFASDYLSN